MSTYHFVQPLDVLMIRGNKAFGGDGQHGEAVMPPWPSLFAGAFRSALLGRDARQLSDFTHGERPAGELGAVLGSRDEPGSFSIRWLSLAMLAPLPSTAGSARSVDHPAASPSPLVPLPADLVAFDDARVPALVALHPTQPVAGSSASGELPLVARLRLSRQIKPQAGRWLDGDGLSAHLLGQTPARTLPGSDLFRRETPSRHRPRQWLAHRRRWRAVYQRSHYLRRPDRFSRGLRRRRRSIAHRGPVAARGRRQGGRATAGSALPIHQPRWPRST